MLVVEQDITLQRTEDHFGAIDEQFALSEAHEVSVDALGLDGKGVGESECQSCFHVVLCPVADANGMHGILYFISYTTLSLNHLLIIGKCCQVGTN